MSVNRWNLVKIGKKGLKSTSLYDSTLNISSMTCSEVLLLVILKRASVLSHNFYQRSGQLSPSVPCIKYIH